MNFRIFFAAHVSFYLSLHLFNGVSQVIGNIRKTLHFMDRPVQKLNLVARCQTVRITCRTTKVGKRGARTVGDRA